MKRTSVFLALLLASAASPAVAQDVLSAGDTVDGSLDAENSSVWTGTIKLEPGETVQIDAIPGTANPGFDLMMELQGDDGETLSDDDGGQETNPRLLFTSEEGGRYEVRVKPYNESMTGTFTLLVRASNIELPEFATLGEIDDMRDMQVSFVGGRGGLFSFQGEAGVVYRLWTEPVGAQDTASPNPLTIGSEADYVDTTIAVATDRTGQNIVAYNDDAGGTLYSDLYFSPDRSGTYFINLGDLVGSQGGRAQFRIARVEVGSPETVVVDNLPATMSGDTGDSLAMVDLLGTSQFRGVSVFALPARLIERSGSGDIEIVASIPGHDGALQIGFDTPLGFAPVRSGTLDGYDEAFGYAEAPIDASADAAAYAAESSSYGSITMRITLSETMLEDYVQSGSSAGDLLVRVVGSSIGAEGQYTITFSTGD